MSSGKAAAKLAICFECRPASVGTGLVGVLKPTDGFGDLVPTSRAFDRHFEGFKIEHDREIGGLTLWRAGVMAVAVSSTDLSFTIVN